MARIRIKDLPKDMKISKEELKRIRGGALTPLLSLGGTGQISIPPDPLDYGKITYPSTGSIK